MVWSGLASCVCLNVAIADQLEACLAATDICRLLSVGLLTASLAELAQTDTDYRTYLSRASATSVAGVAHWCLLLPNVVYVQPMADMSSLK